MPRNLSTVLALDIGFIAAAALTIGGYYAFIPFQDTSTFVTAVISSCLAELVVFGYIVYAVTVRDVRGQPGTPLRTQVFFLIVAWAVLILLSSVVAALTSFAGTFIANRIVLIQLLLTFILGVAVFVSHRQQAVLDDRNAIPQQERTYLQASSGGIDALLSILRSVALRRRDRSAPLDRLSKKLDVLKTELLSASPAPLPDGRQLPTQPPDYAEVRRMLQSLHEQVNRLRDASDDSFDQELAKAGEAAEQVSLTLSRRENAALL
jgi:hypothetical protein